MSIDMSIENARCIRAIVVVIPFANFTNEKATNVLSIIK
jgi:hypothetical protein